MKEYKGYTTEDWSKLSGDELVWILKDQPQLSEFVDWSKLDDWDWKCLLRYRPQFSEFKPDKVKQNIHIKTYNAYTAASDTGGNVILKDDLVVRLEYILEDIFLCQDRLEEFYKELKPVV